MEEDVSGSVRVHLSDLKGDLEFAEVGGDRFLVLPMNQTLGGGLLAKMVVVENSGLALLKLTREGFIKAFESSKQKGFMAASRVVPIKMGRELQCIYASYRSGHVNEKYKQYLFNLRVAHQMKRLMTW